MERLILAHDLGTSANKATLFSEEGELIASRTHPYDSVFLPGGVAEQNPEDWWIAVRVSTRKLLEGRDASRIAAIAFSGMMMGCLCVDRQGRPLRPHMLYCDQRATVQADRLRERAGSDAVYRISGNSASAVNSGAKYMWVKEHEPDIYRETYKILNAKDYMNFKLTGRIATDPTDASGTNMYDLEQWAWSEELVEAAGLDMRIFPEIVPSTDVLGELTRDAAETLGLRPGIPVMAGGADGMCAGIGAGSVAPGKAYVCIGSSAWVGTTTAKPLLDPRQRTITFAHAVPGHFMPLATMLAGGSVYAWLSRIMCLCDRARGAGPEESAAPEGVSPYELMNRLAAESPPGANGLIFLPHLMGERSPRWNSLARGGFVGLGMTTDRADMIRSVMEGVAFNLGLSVDIFGELGEDFRELVMIGGGAKGALWRQIAADIFGATILRSSYLDEATSIGAAIIAGIGAGMYRDFSVAKNFFAIVDRTPPIEANIPVYRERRALFNNVYEALEPLFPRFR